MERSPHPPSNTVLAVLMQKKNLRLTRIRATAKPELVVKSISGGVLVQTEDVAQVDIANHQVKTKR